MSSRPYNNSASRALVEKVQAILREKGLTLYRVSQESAKRYGRSSPHYLPHNFYYDLRSGTFSPSIHQVWMLARISGYRVADWLRVFGLDLEDICRQQIRLPSTRTLVLDTSLTDWSDWVPWFDLQNEDREIPRMAPLASLVRKLPWRRIGSVASGESRFLYAKVGTEDAFAFPELIPGSIVRVDPDIGELRRMDSVAISDRIFLIEHSKGCCCCRIRRLGNGAIVPLDSRRRCRQVQLKMPDEVVLHGMVDFEFRTLLPGGEAHIAKDLARRWQPQALSGEGNFGQMLKRARRARKISFRKAAWLSQRIAQDLEDQRYAASSSSLSEYEIRNDPPRDVHKIITLCSIYGLQFQSVLRQMGIGPLDRGEESMPDRFLARSQRPAWYARSEANIERPGFPDSLLQGPEPIPWFLRHSLDYFSGSPQVALEDFFWVGGDAAPLHPLLERALFVVANRRRKAPPESEVRPLWQRPIWLILDRKGCYLAASCTVENGILSIQPAREEFDPPLEYRYRRDAEIVGQIVAIARRIG